MLFGFFCLIKLLLVCHFRWLAHLVSDSACYTRLIFVTNSNPPFDIEKIITTEADSDLFKLVVITNFLAITSNQKLS